MLSGKKRIGISYIGTQFHKDFPETFGNYVNYALTTRAIDEKYLVLTDVFKVGFNADKDNVVPYKILAATAESKIINDEIKLVAIEENSPRHAEILNYLAVKQ
jgi:hypothetical protein